MGEQLKLKILVFSDSHCVRHFMEVCMETIRPDAVIHLGDMVRDGEKLAQLYPHIRFFQVAGNCDRGRVLPDFPEILVEKLDGVTIYMTHGHLQGVKLFRDKLILEGLGCGADVILYGHTHEPDCRRLPEGCWLMNPGSVGCGGTAGMIVTKAGAAECRIIRQRDLEEI